MSELALAAQWVLAAVFTVSGVAKLRDRPGTTEAFAQFGVPRPLQAAAPLLPVVELLVAVSLVVPATAQWGARAALGLLFVLSGAIAMNLARGNRPDCNCFGQMSSGPIGLATLVRNAALIAIAALAAVPDAVSAGQLFDRLNGDVAWLVVAVVVMALALVALGALVIQLWLQQGRLLLRIDALEAGRGAGPQPSGLTGSVPAPGPAMGTSAPDLEDAQGSGRLSDHWSEANETLVVFGEPNCPACTGLYPELVRWQDQDDRRVVVVTRPVDQPPHPDLSVFFETELAASTAYGVRGTPSAVLVRRGRVSSALAEGADAIRDMLWPPPRPATGATAPVRMSPRPAQGGTPLPDLALARIEGPEASHGAEPSNGADPSNGAQSSNGAEPKEVAADRSELLLFWNEGCTHCRAMIDQLDARVETVGRSGTGFTFVVASEADANAVTQRIKSAAALVDPQMKLSLSLGVPGTPSAVLVGADRHLRSDLAVGPDAILAVLDEQVDRARSARAR